MITDRSALVTRTTGEIGGYPLDQFLNDGWLVCGLDRKAPSDPNARDFEFHQCDLSDREETKKSVELHEQFGAFDPVV